MPMILIVFVWLSAGLTLNRIGHSRDFERKHAAWIRQQFGPQPEDAHRSRREMEHRAREKK